MFNISYNKNQKNKKDSIKLKENIKRIFKLFTFYFCLIEVRFQE
jgi:hypothetical protein